MKDEYNKILDEMVINKSVINQYIDGTKLLSYLLKYDVISYQMKVEISKMGPTESIEHLIKVCLKQMEDEYIFVFIDSLKEAHYDDAYNWLNRKIANVPETRRNIDTITVAGADGSVPTGINMKELVTIIEDEKLLAVLEKLRDHCVKTCYDLELLWPHLILKKYLTEEEKETIYHAQNITSTAKKMKMFEILKTRDAELFRILYQLFKTVINWPNALKIIVTGLSGTEYGFLVGQPASA